MEKQKLRLMRVKRKHILARLLLSLAAVVILLPVVLTALYSFFSPNEIKAFMQTRGSFDAASLWRSSFRRTCFPSANITKF